MKKIVLAAVAATMVTGSAMASNTTDPIKVFGMQLASDLGTVAATATSLGSIDNQIFPASEGLFTLATTGWADVMVQEGKGIAYDEIGGKPGAFEYVRDFSAQEAAAAELLGDGEFTAPHWLVGFDGSFYVMVAPHLFVNGMLMKGANEHKDHFIVVDKDGVATRYDYSADVA